MKKRKEIVMIPFNVYEWEIISDLSGEDIKKLVYSMLAYVEKGEEPTLPAHLAVIFKFMVHHHTKAEKKKKEISELRSIAGKKGQESRRKAAQKC